MNKKFIRLFRDVLISHTSSSILIACGAAGRSATRSAKTNTELAGAAAADAAAAAETQGVSQDDVLASNWRQP